MRFSERWLRTFVDPVISSEELARALTMAGIEVESREPVAPAFTGVVVATVLEAKPHPSADRLKLCRVDAGGAEPLSIVCGAPNVAAGQKVACAQVGAELPGLTIKPAVIRGQTSHGMLCSAKELAITDDSAGIMVLPADAPIGQDLRTYLELDDVIFTLKLTPNRGDCLSMLGIAREVAALTRAPLRAPVIAPVAARSNEARRVRLDAAAACPRYCGRAIQGVNAGAPTPMWMRRVLERAGLRCVSAIVDITNFVMLELGQPLHAFDHAKLSGDISVRMARAGETLTLLNDMHVQLEPDMLVIADEHGAVALAGVMGGAGSAVTDATREVFLESAFFAPEAVAGRARRLGVPSDASHRFERGVDFANCGNVIERATQLVLDICGGEPGPVTDAQAQLPPRVPVLVRAERVRRMLGIALEDRVIHDLLAAQGFPLEHAPDGYRVTPPSYRFDLSREADFVEEIARLHGYDRIPESAPSSAAELMSASEAERSPDLLRQILVERDYREVITYSFVDRQWEQDFAGNSTPVPLLNPIAAQMSVMRSSLIGGLVDTLRFNINRKQERVRVFELGRCFLAGGDGPPGPERQPLRLAGLLWGGALPEQWGTGARGVDFFDCKGDIEALAGNRALRFNAGTHPAFHPGRCAQVFADQLAIGWVGELHPALTQRHELGRAPVVFELDLAPLRAQRVPKFEEPSRFPAVRRDLSFLIDENVPVQHLLDDLRAQAPAVVSEIAVFDLYHGSGIPQGTKSLAFRIVMNDTSKTLAEAEIDTVIGALAESLTSRHGAKLRV